MKITIKRVYKYFYSDLNKDIYTLFSVLFITFSIFQLTFLTRNVKGHTLLNVFFDLIYSFYITNTSQKMLGNQYQICIYIHFMFIKIGHYKLLITILYCSKICINAACLTGKFHQNRNLSMSRIYLQELLSINVEVDNTELHNVICIDFVISYRVLFTSLYLDITKKWLQ